MAGAKKAEGGTLECTKLTPIGGKNASYRNEIALQPVIKNTYLCSSFTMF